MSLTEDLVYAPYGVRMIPVQLPKLIFQIRLYERFLTEVSSEMWQRVLNVSVANAPAIYYVSRKVCFKTTWNLKADLLPLVSRTKIMTYATLRTEIATYNKGNTRRDDKSGGASVNEH